MPTAMVDTVARLRYVGDVKLVELKQIAWEGLAAHHEHVRAKSRAGGSTETLVDVHSSHDGATTVVMMFW